MPPRKKNEKGLKLQRHSDSVKAAVIASLLAGQGVNQTARQYDLPQSTVSRMKAELPRERVDEIGLQKKENLLALIEGHLVASLKAATALAEKAMTDDEWFTRQSASEVAILYGVLTDKSVRILEAADRAKEFARDDEPTPAEDRAGEMRPVS